MLPSDRTLDTATGLIEFFVAPAYEAVFLEVMHYWIFFETPQNYRKAQISNDSFKRSSIL